jgi:serine protease Do
MDRVHPGAWCLHLGHPSGIKPGRDPVPRMGWIVEVADVVLSSSCMIVGGDSGSPLFDDQGRFIGTCFGLNSLTTDYPANYTSVKVLRQAVAEFRELDAKSHVVLRTRIDRRRSIPALQPAWEPVRKATVQVLCDGKQRALGVIADRSGLILTKRSELFGRISCRLYDDRTFAAQVVTSSPSCDLALVQIPATGLAVIPWASQVRAKNGIVVVVPGSSQSVIGVGIVSDGRIQTIPPKPGRLAIEAKQIDAGLVVTRMHAGSYAADMLRAGDLITNIDGHTGESLRDFSGIKEITSRVAGDRIPVAYVRQGTVQHADVALSPERYGGEWERQTFSDRRSGYPSVFIHEAVIAPQECGGAVIDGSGCVLGINIARADRHETLTIPAEIVVQELHRLMRDANVHFGNRNN